MTKLDFPTLNFTPVSLFKVNETEDETEEKKNDIQSVRKRSVLANSANGYTEKYGPKIRKNGGRHLFIAWKIWEDYYKEHFFSIFGKKL